MNRGVKAGGYNLFPALTPTVLDASLFAYKPEVLLDYEGGLKMTLGRTTIDLSSFYCDYQNYQAFRFAGLSGSTVNDPARYHGGEADVIFHPLTGLQLEFQGSAVHARVDDVSITPGINRTVRPTFTPALQAGCCCRTTSPSGSTGAS